MKITKQINAEVELTPLDIMQGLRAMAPIDALAQLLPILNSIDAAEFAAIHDAFPLAIPKMLEDIADLCHYLKIMVMPTLPDEYDSVIERLVAEYVDHEPISRFDLNNIAESIRVAATPVTVEAYSKDEDGNYEIPMVLDDKDIKVLVPDGSIGAYALVDKVEYGLNLVSEGHYV